MLEPKEKTTSRLKPCQKKISM